jgi:hypothetical protein
MDPMFGICRFWNHPIKWTDFLLLLDSGFGLSGELSGKNHKHVTAMSRQNVMHTRQAWIFNKDSANILVFASARGSSTHWEFV